MIGFFFDLVEKIVDPLCQMQHGFSTVVSGNELLLCLLEFLSITDSRFIFAEILLDQSRLYTCRNSGDLRNMFCCICCTHQWRIKDLIRLDPLTQNLMSCLDCLLMPFLCQCNVCRSTDLILYIPDSLSMSHKIKMSHYIQLLLFRFSLSYHLYPVNGYLYFVIML